MIRSKPPTDAYREAWERVFGEQATEALQTGMVAPGDDDYDAIRRLSALAQRIGFQPDAVCLVCKRLVESDKHVCAINYRAGGHIAGCAAFSTVLGKCDCPPERISDPAPPDAPMVSAAPAEITWRVSGPHWSCQTCGTLTMTPDSHEGHSLVQVTK